MSVGNLKFRLLIISMNVLSAYCSAHILASAATIELILHNDDNVRAIKYIRGIYTTAGAVLNVEGNIEQVGKLQIYVYFALSFCCYKLWLRGLAGCFVPIVQSPVCESSCKSF